MTGGVISFPRNPSFRLFQSCLSNPHVESNSSLLETPPHDFSRPSSHTSPAKYPKSSAPNPSPISRHQLPNDNSLLPNSRNSKGLLRHSRGTVPSIPAPAVPAGCAFNVSSNPSYTDDDDAISITEAWPISMHCSAAGLTSIPPSLPATLLNMYVNRDPDLRLLSHALASPPPPFPLPLPAFPFPFPSPCESFFFFRHRSPSFG